MDLIKREDARNAVVSSSGAMDAVTKINAIEPSDVVRLVDALSYYADQFCEGFCQDLPEFGTYHESMDDQCAGCKARATLANFPSLTA